MLKKNRLWSGTPAALMQLGGLLMAGIVLASCAQNERVAETPAAPAEPETAVAAAPPAASAVQAAPAVPADEAVVDPGPSPLEQLQRDGRLVEIERVPERAPRVQVQGNNTIALNLEQEDLRSVFERLGGALQLNMVIDPAINAVVSVRTTESNPLTYDDIWPLMRMLARSAGVAIEQSGDVYRFFISQERVPTEIVMPNFLGSATASEVLQVTPLRYITREVAAQVLAPLVQDNGSLIPLGARNLIGISGSPGLLSRINALLAIIDDDPFQNQGIKLYSLKFTQAADVATELAAILALVQGGTGSYQALGLPRVNAVLVVGAPGQGFAEVDRWVAALDTESQEQAEQLFVYAVKHLNAVSLATTLGNVFGAEDEQVQAPAPQQAVSPLFGDGPGVPAGQIPVAVAQVPGAVPVPGQVPGAPQPGAPAGAAAGGAAGPAATAAGVSADLAVGIVADEDTNSLLIRATPRDYRQLLTVIRGLDVSPRQVLINAVIGAATLNEGAAYGVDWVRVSANLASGPANLSSNVLPGDLFGDDGSPVPGSGLVLTRTFANASATIDATLNAIAQDSEVTLLARPTLMATNNQQGEIIVGQSVPVDSGSSVAGNGTVTSNIAYRDVGIVLTITPQINEDGLINLQIFQSLSSVEDSSGGVSDNPIFTNQEITTTAVVGDGSIITLGGLIQEDKVDSNRGVPGLRKIPGFKALFSYTEQTTVRRELFVILRPQIIDGDEGDALAQQAFRDQFDALKEVVESVWN